MSLPGLRMPSDSAALLSTGEQAATDLLYLRQDGTKKFSGDLLPSVDGVRSIGATGEQLLALWTLGIKSDAAITLTPTTNLILAAGELEMNDAIHWDADVAVTAARAEITRVGSSLHYNVPTGAVHSWRVNDSGDMILSATALDLRGNNLVNIGATMRFDATSTISTETGDLILNPSGSVLLSNNSLLNVGAAGNDWTANELVLSTSNLAATNLIRVDNSNPTSGSHAHFRASVASGVIGQAGIEFREGSGDGSIANMSYLLLYDAGSARLALNSQDINGAAASGDIWRIPDGQTTIDAKTTWDINTFDKYDDVALIESALRPTANAYDFGKGVLLRGREALIQVGVLKRYEDGWVGYNDQRMAALLAGGIYQNRGLIDATREELLDRISALEETVAQLARSN